MKYLYGNFSTEQTAYIKSSMCKSIMWLLIYADPKTNEEYADGVLQSYFKYFMIKLGGLNDLLGCPTEMVDILSILQAAYLDCIREDFIFNSEYRKLILDARAIVPKIREV